MVLVQAFQRFQQMERKPPVTLAVIAFCVVGFFAPEAVGGLFGAATVQDACFSAKAIVTRFQLMRLVSSYWFHGDEISLAYNMSSLLWKGYVLETRMGSEAFASALAVLTLLVSVLSCATAAALNVAFSSREAFVACTHGISPILFALKVLMYNDPTDPHGNVSFYGMVELPKRWAALAEMALLQLMHPSLAMLAVHAGGALAGYAFLHRARLLRLLRKHAGAYFAPAGPPPAAHHARPPPPRASPPRAAPPPAPGATDAEVRRRAAAAAAARHAAGAR